jgi:general secretion pathway protein N
VQTQQSSDPSLQDQLSLIASIVSPRESFAILTDEKNKRIVRLKMGESYSGWTLLSVQGRDAVLQNGRDTAVLTLASP